MKMRYRATLATMIVAVLLVLSACGATNNSTQIASTQGATAASEGGKTVTIGIVNSPVTLNQINDQGDSASTTIQHLINDSLLDVDDQLKFTPKLADSIDTTDHQNYTVHLNKDAKWSDGQPFTTKDVEFTLLTALNPQVETTLRLFFIEGLDDTGKLKEGQNKITGLTIVDDHTFKIKTKAPIDPDIFNESFASKIYFLPEHILKDVAPDQLATNEYFQKPEVTIGPFKFAKFLKDQYFQVVKNDQYYRSVPKLDQIFVKVLPATNLVAQLQTGEIQMNSLPVGLIPITEYDKVKSLPDINLTSSQTTEPVEIFFNTGTIQNPKVRQAIAYALNRQQIVTQLLKGQAELIDGSIPSSNQYAATDIPKYTYDPAKAQALLQEAGWDANQTIRFLVPVGNKVREQAADILEQNLEAVGIKVDIQKFDFPTLMQKTDSKDYDITIFTRDYYVDPSRYFNMFESDNANNIVGYRNPKLDQLLKDGRAEADPAKRKIIYHQVQEILHEDVPSLGVYSEKRLQAVSKKVKVGQPLNIGMFNHVNEWDSQ
ncbi:peptide/nickel transport system substrate-binding protein [Paenibacillus sp. SORGH_AS306]|uniref:ABC transporter substrate-binding protein n=1 Tax=unclassified Paenibacillus TaxID=185978 RepID=UPI002787A142|nr:MULTISPECIES: ABC transporter substrate-binding protein [unclassified Paenibacillus]MDQ1232712.1 peptide/nickel transport system substrate-binding protein [Paenibacillus sp. SORGH_AS_0306]MDR6109762.1 peptide/nickel transport system substrate-binding protein [Paenibacillus sp. SORGH_AS_0338]